MGGSIGHKEPSPSYEVDFESKSGKKGRVQVSLYPLQKLFKKKHWAVYLHDVSVEMNLQEKSKRQVEAKEQVIQNLKEAQGMLVQSAKLALVGEFIAQISHELNNPLAIASVALENLDHVFRKKEKIDSQVLQITTSARSALSRMERLSQELKSFVHNSGEVSNLNECNLADVFNRATEFTEIFSRESGLLVQITISPQLPKIQADSAMLEQVFVNLVKNANDALLEHQVKNPQIVVSAEINENQDYLFVNFDDNGPGVPEEKVDSLFTPFFTTKESGKGTGLGLSIARGIANRHGGDLTYEKNEKGGARFRLSLAVDPNARYALEREGKIRILVVDDEPAIRETLSNHLESSGYQVATASNGKEGVSVCKEFLPNMIISDIRMPELDGIEFARIVEASFPETRMIFVSGSTLLNQLKHSGVRFERLIAKPFSLKEISGVVDTIASEIRQKKISDEAA